MTLRKMLKLIRFTKPRCLCRFISDTSTTHNQTATKPKQTHGGLFNATKIHNVTDFYTYQKRIIKQTEALMQEINDPNGRRKVVEVLDDMSNNLCRLGDLAEFIRVAHVDNKLVKAAEDICIEVSRVIERLNTNVELYGKAKASLGVDGGAGGLDEHVTRLFLYDFEQSGIHLARELRDKVVALNDYVLTKGHEFTANTTKPRVVQTKNLPAHVKSAIGSTTSNLAHVTTPMAYHPDPTVRELAYRIFYNDNVEQETTLRQLLTARQQLAETCGFDNYTERALHGSIAEQSTFVDAFLNDLNAQLSDVSRDDFARMGEMKRADGCLSPLAMWDVRYYYQRAKDRIGNDLDALPYFTLDNCLRGLNIITRGLFGVEMSRETVRDGEVWADGVFKLVVRDDAGVLGFIYCDFYARANKPAQESHYTVQCYKAFDGADQLPIVVIMLNLSGGSPTVLQAFQVDSLFHEMGHALHSMLGRTKYQHISGTRCSTDVAEIPSLFLEHYASEPEIIKMFAKHHVTNATIPDDILRGYCASKSLFCGAETQLQVFYSMVDHVLHTRRIDSAGTCHLVHAIQKQYYGLEPVANTSWHLRFSHLVCYGAKYYAYLVSKAVATLIWQKYFQSNPLSRVQGERYRAEFLAHGGGKPGRQLVRDYLKEFRTTDLIQALVDDVKCKS